MQNALSVDSANIDSVIGQMPLRALERLDARDVAIFAQEFAGLEGVGVITIDAEMGFAARAEDNNGIHCTLRIEGL